MLGASLALIKLYILVSLFSTYYFYDTILEYLVSICQHKSFEPLDTFLTQKSTDQIFKRLTPENRGFFKRLTPEIAFFKTLTPESLKD